MSPRYALMISEPQAVSGRSHGADVDELTHTLLMAERRARDSPASLTFESLSTQSTMCLLFSTCCFLSVLRRSPEKKALTTSSHHFHSARIEAC